MAWLIAFGKQAFEDFKTGFAFFGETIITVINSVLLTIAYIFGVSVSALFMGKKRKDIIDMSLDTKRTSYWIDLPAEDTSKESSYRQF